ncbi:hypothetical protein MD484_g7720, partial [Candolleomyces efflorescens]
MSHIDPWACLNKSGTPRKGEVWPDNLDKLDIANEGSGSRSLWALKGEQRGYVWAVSIFASQASAQGRGTEYLSQVYARYFARWPVRLNLDVAWAVAKQKERSTLRISKPTS